MVKLQTSNFVRIFTASIGRKALKNFGGKVAVGIVRDSRKFSHRGRIMITVIFAIAQLSSYA